MIYPQVSARRFSLKQSQISYLFVLIGLVGAFIQGGAIGRLSKRFGDINLAVTGLFLMALSMGVMPLAGSLSLFVLFSIGLAAGNSLSTPTLNALASKGASGAVQGRVLGALQSAGSLGRVFGPAMGGLLLTTDHARPSLQYGNTPFVAGALLMLGAFFMALTLRQFKAETRGAAVEVPAK